MSLLGLGSNKTKFTIDDAFETEEDDLKNYGTTTENTPLKQSLFEKGTISVRIDEPLPDKRFEKLKLTGGSFSKDSDSLIHSDSIHPEKFDSTQTFWWKHPKVQENKKVMVAAFGLLFIGIGLLVTGVTVLIKPEMGVQSFVFFIAGAICFIPGAYHVVYVYCAAKGHRGYNFYNLPLFN